MLTFNKEKHEYRFNDKIVPSVTQIISDLNDLSSISEHVLKNKGELGTEFHRIIKLHFLDDLVYDTIDSRLVPAFNTFLDWSKPRLDEFKKALSEYKMFDQKLWLAGTLDLALRGELFDWKLRNYNPVVDILQLDGYDTILGGGKRKRWTMCFDMKSGKLNKARSEHSQSHSMFVYMLDYFHAEDPDVEEYFKMTEAWKGEFN
jgi:hypothetical protein